jgi:hypothetical protein
VTKQEQVNSIRSFLRRIFSTGDAIEIRGLGAPGKGTMRLLTTDFSLAANVASKMSEWSADVYFTLNPIRPTSKYADRATWNWPYVNAVFTAGDKDIDTRNIYLVDVDPVRPSGTAATAEQRDSAMKVATTIRQALTERGWPEPIVIDSGNGTHLLFKGDRCAPGGEILRHALKFLKSTFSTTAAEVDHSVHNAARISRLPFTMNKKAGRMASVIEYPKTFDPLPACKIHHLATEGGLKTHYDAAKPTSDRQLLLDEDGVRRLIAEFPGQLHLARVTHRDGETHFGFSECPFAGRAHVDQGTGTGKSAIMLGPDWIGYSCFAGDCAEHTFSDLLRLLHRKTGRRPSMQIWETDDAVLEARWGGVEDVSKRTPAPKLTTAEIEAQLPVFETDYAPRAEARLKATEEWQRDYAAWKAREFPFEDFTALLGVTLHSDGVWRDPPEIT